MNAPVTTPSGTHALERAGDRSPASARRMANETAAAGFALVEPPRLAPAGRSRRLLTGGPRCARVGG